jgi:hypothetical protein
MAALGDRNQEELNREFDERYERYGKPLEAEHYGKYLLISPDGATVVGESPEDVVQQAEARFGPDNFLYKIGPRALGKWRVISKADHEAFLASLGGWEGPVDTDKLLTDIYESRRISTRPPVELGNLTTYG